MRSVNPISSTFDRSGSRAMPVSVTLSGSRRCQVISWRLNSDTYQSLEGPADRSLMSQEPSASFRVILSCRSPTCFVLIFTFANPVKSTRSEEHTSELQSRENLVCRLLLE